MIESIYCLEDKDDRQKTMFFTKIKQLFYDSINFDPIAFINTGGKKFELGNNKKH